MQTRISESLNITPAFSNTPFLLWFLINIIKPTNLSQRKSVKNEIKKKKIKKLFIIVS